LADNGSNKFIPPLVASLPIFKRVTKRHNMKFINYLESITGVDVYAMSSFIIFFTFFVIMTLWALKADKKLIDKINRIPLDN
jgi:hypothetical protein